MTPEKLSKMPVRQREDQWEVLIAENNAWVQCNSKEEAQTLALVPVLEYEALGQLRSGTEFAAELDRAADAMEQHRFGYGTRFFRWLAEEARKRGGS